MSEFKLTAQDCALAACEVLRVAHDDMMSHYCRDRRVVFAREIAIFLARQDTHASYTEIAQIVGHSSHATTIAAMRRATKKHAADQEFRLRVAEAAAQAERYAMRRAQQ